MIITAGSTSNSIDVFLCDDNGLALTGKVYTDFNTAFTQLTFSLGTNTANNTATSYATLAALTTAYSAGGVKERGGGWYRLDIPDAMVATVGTTPRIIGEATGYHLFHETIDIVGYAVTGATIPADMQTIKARAVSDPGSGNTVYFPIAAYGGKGGVPILDPNNGTQLIGYLGTQVGTFVTGFLGTPLSESSAGYVMLAFKKVFDVATPVLTAASVNQTADVGVRIPYALTFEATHAYPEVQVANYATNQGPPTVGAIATAVWQDATAGDFTVSNSIGKLLYNIQVDTSGYFKVSAGTGTGQLSISGGVVAASGDWAAPGAKMDLADVLSATGVANLKAQLGKVPATVATGDGADAASANAQTTAAAIYAAVKRTANAIEPGYTDEQIAAILLRFAAASTSAGGMTIHKIKNSDPAITATLNNDGSRTVTALDVT